MEVQATEEEKQLFAALKQDGEREIFIQRFWSARDLQSAVPGNSARERWDQHHQMAVERIGRPGSGPGPLPAEIQLSYPGLRNGRPVLEALIELDRATLLDGRNEAGPRGHRFELRGEIVRDGEIRDRATWSLALDEAAGNLPPV